MKEVCFRVTEATRFCGSQNFSASLDDKPSTCLILSSVIPFLTLSKTQLTERSSSTTTLETPGAFFSPILRTTLYELLFKAYIRYFLALFLLVA